jgi:predicted  nucleic acid-binding Zn-ribbon protein
VSGSEPRDERVEELLRVNERLAAEVRNLSHGGGEARGPAAMPTARRLGRLSGERDRLRAELDSARAELEEVGRHRTGLERQNQELAQEVARLSSGFPGLLRRVRRRLLSRGGGGAAPAPRER